MHVNTGYNPMAARLCPADRYVGGLSMGEDASGWWVAPCSLLFFHSQASFVASGNRTDISLDDPNFWQKWAKIAELDTDAKNEKVVSSL